MYQVRISKHQASKLITKWCKDHCRLTSQLTLIPVESKSLTTLIRVWSLTQFWACHLARWVWFQKVSNVLRQSRVKAQYLRKVPSRGSLGWKQTSNTSLSLRDKAKDWSKGQQARWQHQLSTTQSNISHQDKVQREELPLRAVESSMWVQSQPNQPTLNSSSCNSTRQEAKAKTRVCQERKAHLAPRTKFSSKANLSWLSSSNCSSNCSSRV